MNKLVTHSVWQESEIDGEVIAVNVIANTTSMKIIIRDLTGFVYKFVCQDLELALNIEQKHLNKGTIRLFVDGKWNRTTEGWRADAKQCKVTEYESLRDESLIQIMNELRQIPNNGWLKINNVDQTCRELRGKD